MQQAAVLHTGAPLLILAGAGSGKTRVITMKIAHLLSQGVDPRSILAVTFTNKAAKEMRDRAAEIQPAARDCMIRTFHSFGSWLLRRNYMAAGLVPEFCIYDDDDQVQLLAQIYPQMPKPSVRILMRAISRLKDLAVSPDDDSGQFDPEVLQAYKNYQQELERIGNVDFGDLILKPLRLLRDNSNIASRIRDRFRVILVDEYQDSNGAQSELLHYLYDQSSYLCVVGDDDQSIYRFRGAEVRNIIDFPQTFAGTDIIRLEQNYRSSASILEIAQAVVSHNSGRLGKQLWTENPAGDLPQVLRVYDEKAEAEWCASLLEKGNAEGTAILYRTNAQSRSFETLFLRRGIPYRIVGTLRFYEREEVKDGIALLRFVVNPRDSVAFARIVNKPARGIGKKSIAAILQHAGGGDLLSAMERAPEFLPKKAGQTVQQSALLFRTIQGYLKEGVYERLSDLMRQALLESSLFDYHKKQDELAGLQKVQNLEELENAAEGYDGNIDGLLAFLESIELDSGARQDDLEDAVTLITMHNTKGLEFDRVIISGMDDGLFPRDHGEDLESLEEERRLFYVAVTRARKELYFTTAGQRRVHGRLVDMRPSRFLQEIPSELLYKEEQQENVEIIYTDEEEYPRGCGVYHDDYGSGRVIRSDWKNDQLVVLVQFETGQTARFLPEYTPLERISVDD